MKPLVLSGLMLGAVLATPALAQTVRGQSASTEAAFAATTLDLSASGEVEVAPDQASITLGVQTRAPSAAAAMAENARQMNAVMAALRGAGIEAKDIRTSNLSLSAQYDYAPNQPPRLNGYQATDDVTVSVEHLDRLGPAIDAVTAAGANQINGIGFGLKSPQAAEDAARLEAVKALRAKAELYAKASGYHVARLVNLTEASADQPVRPMPMMMAKAAVQGVPVSGGQLTVRVEINGVFELAK